MKKLIALCVITSALSACVHKMDIEQGNIITQEMISKLHTGMSEEQVKTVMGTPVLLNTFDDNEIDYVYTFKPAYQATTEKRVILTFRKHRLVRIEN